MRRSAFACAFALALLAVLAALGIASRVALADDAAEALLASGDVGATVSISPEQVVVGQQATLAITLRTTTWFAKAATLPEPSVPFAFVKRYGQMGINGTDRANGKTFTTQTWEWLLFATRPGRYEIPALEVVIRPAGDDRKAIEVHASTEPLAFDAIRPAGVGDADYVVAVPSLEVGETLDRSLEDLRVSDAVVRTITVEMADAPAMLLPSLPREPIDGVGVYAASPRVEDAFSRGELKGRRVEAVTYVFERPGRFHLPEVRVPWWNTQDERLEAAVVKGHAVEVAVNPDLDQESVSGTQDTQSDSGDAGVSLLDVLADTLPWIAGLLLLVLLLVHLWRRLLGPLARRLRAWNARRHESESAYFRHLEAACRGSDPAATRGALRVWLDRARGPGTTIEAYVVSTHDEGLADAMARLDTRLYGDAPRTGEPPWSGAALLEALRRSRRRGVARSRDDVPALRLNPRHSER